jgi:hypothetical protein
MQQHHPMRILKQEDPAATIRGVFLLSLKVRHHTQKKCPNFFASRGQTLKAAELASWKTNLPQTAAKSSQRRAS